MHRFCKSCNGRKYPMDRRERQLSCPEVQPAALTSRRPPGVVADSKVAGHPNRRTTVGIIPGRFVENPVAAAEISVEQALVVGPDFQPHAAVVQPAGEILDRPEKQASGAAAGVLRQDGKGVETHIAGALPNETERIA